MLKIYQKPDSDQPASSYQTEGKNDNLLIISTIMRWSKIFSFNKKNFRVIKMCFTKFENFCQTKGRLQAKFKFCLKLLHYVWEMVKNLFFHQNNDFQLIKTCLATNFTQMPRGNHREQQLNQSGPPFGFQPFLKKSYFASNSFKHLGDMVQNLLFHQNDDFQQNSTMEHRHPHWF